MLLSGLLELIRTQSAFRALAPGATLGLPRSARPYVTAALAGQAEGPQLVVTARVERAHDLAEQLPAWDPNLRVLSFPEPNPIFYERAPWGPRTIRARLQVLAEMLDSGQAAQEIVEARGLAQVSDVSALKAAVAQTLDANPGWVSDDGWVIVQIHPREYEALALENLALFDQRTYGSVMLCFYAGS